MEAQFDEGVTRSCRRRAETDPLATGWDRPPSVEAGGVITLEEWAEVRRLHRAEGVPIKEIARRLGLARNTVRAALRADAPPSRERGPRGLFDVVEPQIRALLVEFPRMPATVIAERIGWAHSITILKDRVRAMRTGDAAAEPG